MASLLLGLAFSCFASSRADAQESIEPGDELQISIPEVGGMVDHDVTVDDQGEVTLGIYGSVEVAGMTVSQAEDAVRQHLGRYIRNTSRVSVTLLGRQRVVLVTGEVVAPGLQTLHGTPDAWLAIQAAGGVAPGGDLSRVVVFRNGQETPVDVRAYLTRERTDALPFLLTGDTVFVPAEPGLPAVQGVAAPFLGDAALQSKVFVLGAVATPGVYDRTPGLNPLTALALAGGPAPLADLSNVRLITMTQSQRVDLEAWMLGESTGPGEIPSDGGAIMYVPTRSTGAVHDPFTSRIYLMGNVATTGPLEVDGPTPLVEVLGLAGGYAANADLSDVHLIRQRERYSLSMDIDLEGYLQNGGGAGSALVEPGDVIAVGAEPATSAWQDVVGGIRDLALISSAALLWLDYSQR